jgi:hypothetical protein
VIGLLSEEFGRRFTAFLKAGARFVLGSLKVATVSFDPQKFIGEDWTFWKGLREGNGKDGEEERDKVSMALAEADLEKSDFLTCLEGKETSITGEEKLLRLRESNRTLYGLNIFCGLWQDYQQNKAGSVLERLYQQKSIAYLDFFGDVLRDLHGRRCVLYLCRGGVGRWDWSYSWLISGWNSRAFTVVSQ